MAIRVHLMHTTDHHESMGTPAPGGAYFNSLLAEEADIPLQRCTLPGQSKTDIRIWNIHDGTSDTLVIMLPKGYSAVQDAEHMKHTGAERLLVMPTERAKEVNSTTLLPNNHIRLISYCIGIRCAKCELELPLHNFGDIAKVQITKEGIRLDLTDQTTKAEQIIRYVTSRGWHADTQNFVTTLFCSAQCALEGERKNEG